MIKTNKKQNLNKTIIRIVFLIGGGIYLVIGMLGQLGITGRTIVN